MGNIRVALATAIWPDSAGMRYFDRASGFTLPTPAVIKRCMIIATIKGIEVTQDEHGTVTWTSGADIDADGANGQTGGPFAYRYPQNNGLDKLENAGWPNDDWTNVLYNDGTGHPLTDGSGNAFSRTSLVLRDQPIAFRAVDAYSVPYVVVNPHVRLNSRGVVLGCLATVTYGPKMIQAVVADVSGGGTIGEISIAAAKALGIDPSPLSGGTPDNVTFSLYPGTAAVLGDVTYPLQPA